jgi:membrane-associated phospholipid phosphatase
LEITTADADTVRRMRGWPVGVALWLVVVGAAEVAGVIALWDFFVHSEHGQELDTIALTGNSIGQSHVSRVTETVLNTMSVVSIAVAVVILVFIALLRGRVLTAIVALLLIAGANITTQVLKAGLYRPRYGVDQMREAVGNSFPSGSTTAAAAVVVALIFVLPAKIRGLAALVGAAFAALVGVATLSAGWHRPSDAIAALLIVGGWACAGGLILLLFQRRAAPQDVAASDREAPHWFVIAMLALAGLVLLGLAVLGLHWIDEVADVPADQLSRRRLLAGYAGGAAGIAAAAAFVIALVMTTVHRVLPRTTAAPVPTSA